MDETFLVRGIDGQVAEFAARLAAETGDDLGLVNTAIEFQDEKVSGGRVEEAREFAGQTFQTFDEPVFIGSAIAQLAGYADAVVVDSLDDWAARLLRRFPDEPIEREAELKSLISVVQSHMCRLVLISRGSENADANFVEWRDEILEQVGNVAEGVVDVATGNPTVVKGTIPTV